MRRTLVSLGLIAGLGAFVAGCSDQYAGRYAVSGTVSLEGKPLDHGEIEFHPLDEQGTLSGAPITDGQYEIPRSAGLKPGKYLVRITSGDGMTQDIRSEDEIAQPGGSTNIISVDRIPPEWNERSEKQVEVKDESAEFNFAIPKANDTSKAKKRKESKRK